MYSSKNAIKFARLKVMDPCCQAMKHKSKPH